MRLVESKNRATQKYMETHSEYSIFVQFGVRSTKRTTILSTRSNAVLLYDTLHAEFIQKSSMKTKDQLCQRESVILRPRVVLKANSQCGSQDLFEQDFRNRNEMRRVTGKPEATLLIIEYVVTQRLVQDYWNTQSLCCDRPSKVVAIDLFRFSML